MSSIATDPSLLLTPLTVSDPTGTDGMARSSSQAVGARDLACDRGRGQADSIGPDLAWDPVDSRRVVGALWAIYLRPLGECQFTSAGGPSDNVVGAKSL
jgi:hypothetical protein